MLCPTNELLALQLLHSVGWVHRDISPGNIMRIGGSVKLGDLEYAKKLGSDRTHEFRTVSFIICLGTDFVVNICTGHSPLYGLRSGIAKVPPP